MNFSDRTNLKISVVINTLNRATLLKNTLSSLQYLDYPDFEVVVVDGPSTDGTEDLLNRWGHDNIKIGRCPEKNLSMSRNIGIAMASGDLVAFIDDDAIPEPEWLNQIADAFDADIVGGAGGKVFDNSGYIYQYQYANSNRLGRGRWQLTEPSPHYCFPAAYEFPYLQGTNTAFRKSALLEIGGFDEEFEYYLDETDVCLRLIDRGYLIRQLDNAFVHHKFAPSHIRTKNTGIFRYPVMKSKVYFALRHAGPYRPRAEIDEDNRLFIQDQRDNVHHAIEKNHLTDADLATFEEHAARALSVGTEAARRPPRLMTPELLTSQRDDFRPFPAKRPKMPKQTIVLLCEDYPPALLGGIARITHDKATALAQLGHKVHVIARSTTVNTVDFEDGVWVHRINADHQALSPEAARLHVPSTHWDQSQSFLNELDRIAAHNPIDIVEAPIWNIVGIAVLLSGRYKLAVSLQTTLKLSLGSRPDLTGNPETMKNFVTPIVALEKYLMERSPAVIANSRGIVAEVEAAYDMKIAHSRLYLCHHGMPDWRVEAEPQHGAESNTVNVLFVGRLEKRKGIGSLLEAIPAIVATHPEARFHIVGDDTIQTADGSTYRAAFERAHPALSGAQVIFHGKVDDDSLRRHYASCDFFVGPSRFESFGLIYVEAMMFGKAVIACNAGGIPEVVADGETGILVPADSAEDLRAAIIRLIDDPALRATMGRNGRRSYETRFTDEKMALESLEIYRAMMEAGSVPIEIRAS